MGNMSLCTPQRATAVATTTCFNGGRWKMERKICFVVNHVAANVGEIWKLSKLVIKFEYFRIDK